LVDRAAFQMLHALAVACHLHGGVSSNTCIKRRKAGPHGKAAETDQQHNQAPAQRPTKICIYPATRQLERTIWAPSTFSFLSLEPPHVNPDPCLPSAPASPHPPPPAGRRLS